MPSRRGSKRNSSNDDGDSKPPTKVRKLKAHHKHKWSPQETIDLVKAVKELHDGKTFIPFAQILASDQYQFHKGRTSLHLGDKWKRLKTQYDGVVADVDSLCDHVISMETERMNAPPVASLHRRSEKMPRKRWTEDEVKALMDAHKEYGNKWATILRNNRDKFDAKRTTMDLKDKMRNLYGGGKKSKKSGSKKGKKTSMAL